MSEQNIAIAFRRVEEIWHNGNLAVVEELVAADYVGHWPGGADLHGREDFKQFVTSLRTAFPDLRFTAEDVMAVDDKIVDRYTGRGTHQGDFSGIPATGRTVTFSGIDIFRIANGQMAEDWLQPNLLGILQQLGAVPAGA
jgi:steroid delta-isomerase-like uncharacterized protein